MSEIGKQRITEKEICVSTVSSHSSVQSVALFYSLTFLIVKLEGYIPERVDNIAEWSWNIFELAQSRMQAAFCSLT